MFGWRKRNEGFEWRQYVRTTILVRREKRRQKIDELREAAVKGVKEAGEKGIRAGAAGAEKVGRATKAGIAEAGRSLHENVWIGLRERMARGGAYSADAMRRLGVFLGVWARRESARKAVLGVALVAVFWAGARYSGHGLDREATVAAATAIAALAVAAIMALLAAPRGSALADGRERVRDMIERLPIAELAGRAGGARALLAGVAALGAIALGAFWLGSGSRPELASLTGFVGGRPDVVSGRAIAVSGDTLRVSGRLIRLAGIEAPERDQKCGLGSARQWACGSAAAQALAGRVRSKNVRCEVTDAGGSNGPRGVCKTDDVDIAAELVRAGHVFAGSGWFGRYAGLEDEARAARIGLWRGEAERPSDYRTKRWEEARRAAPDGCPIKGQKTSDRRVYVLPWSPQYDRVKVRTARGERWFCSEAEAQAAGWKPIEES